MSGSELVTPTPSPATSVETIGQNIRRARRRAVLTLDHLAARTGISKPYLSLIENRGQVPAAEKLRRLELALGFATEELVTEAFVQRAPANVRAALQEQRGRRPMDAAAHQRPVRLGEASLQPLDRLSQVVDPRPCVADPADQRVLQGHVVRLRPLPQQHVVMVLPLHLALEALELLATQILPSHASQPTPGPAGRGGGRVGGSVSAERILAYTARMLTLVAVLRQIEASGYAVSVHYVSDVVEMHAVKVPQGEPVHISRCVDGDGEIESLATARELAAMCGVDLEGG